MIKCFDLDSNQLRIRDILNDKNFLEIEIYAISNAKPNRNKSYFTPESMKKGIETFTDKPILGFFNNQDDFESHNGKVAYDPELDKEFWDNSNGEQILGFVRQSDRKEITETSDGLLWIVCTAMVCTQYNYKQVKRLLKDRKKKISVEVSIKDSEVIDGIEYIYDFELIGITILGSRKGVEVREGIEGAHLSVLEAFEQKYFEVQKKALTFAYSQLDYNENKEDKDLAKDDIGTENALKINKSKEAMSDTKWGEVDKTELRNRVVAASNFKEIVEDVFLDLRDGWEEGEVSKLKYPVMQIVDNDMLVYNRDALASAKAYADKNGENKVLEKLKLIYEHLELDFESEEERECDQFCDLYEDDECGCDDGCQGGENHGDEVTDDDNEGNQENHCEPLLADNGNQDSEGCPEGGPEGAPCDAFTMEELMEFKINLEAECGELKMKCENAETKCAELEEKCCNYETKISEYEEKYKDYEEIKTALDKANEKFAEIKVNEQKAYIAELADTMKIAFEDLTNVYDKCEKREYESNENIEQDIAYIVFKKKVVAKMSDDKFFTTIIPQEPINKSLSRKNKSIVERLQDNLNK